MSANVPSVPIPVNIRKSGSWIPKRNNGNVMKKYFCLEKQIKKLELHQRSLLQMWIKNSPSKKSRFLRLGRKIEKKETAKEIQVWSLSDMRWVRCATFAALVTHIVFQYFWRYITKNLKKKNTTLRKGLANSGFSQKEFPLHRGIS